MSEAKKFDHEKSRMDLLPADALLLVGAALAFGAQKYGDNNWRRGMQWSRCYAAALRHLCAFWEGEDLDPESGLPHLAHAICNILFLLSYQQNGRGSDNRVKRGKS